MSQIVEKRLLARVSELLQEYESLTPKLQEPEILNRPQEYARLSKRFAELRSIAQAYTQWEELSHRWAEARSLAQTEKDPELRLYFGEESDNLEKETKHAWEHLLECLTPKNSQDERNVILEIRAGIGGEEAALFAADLFRMYSRFVEKVGWKIHVVDAHPTDLGGYREIVTLVEGHGAYARLKFESGIHRVQRIPVTEASGRIHTSAVSVAVLPEAEEIEVDIRESELRTDVFSSSGPGGQHVNKSMTAVRLTHIPTGIVVVCQDERSLGQNRRKALRILRTRLQDYYKQQQSQSRSESRRIMVGHGDRSEKIRTYNFPQNRVTDHRIGLTLYRLEDILKGDLDEILDALMRSERAEKLKQWTA